MKIQTLLIALALTGGAALAAAPSDMSKAPASTDTSASATTSTTASTEHVTKHKAKKVAKKHHAKKHVASRHHREHLARNHHSNTHAMGAGAASPDTDLNASHRQARMDAAYSDWKAKQGR